MTRADPTNRGRRRAALLLRAAAAAMIASGLGGCYTAQDTRDTAAAFPTDYRQRHPIAIRESGRPLELFIGTNRGGLTPSQRAEVLAFAHTWKKEATGGVMIQLPAGTPNERAAADSLPEIQSILAAVGLPPTAVMVQTYQPNSPGQIATVRISYPRMTAEAGPCGLWPDDIGPSVDNPNYLSNRPYWNLGCATQRNLAAMVENPADLVQPRGDTPVYTARRTDALDKYRRGEVPSGAYKNEDKGKISDLGK